MKNRNNGVVKRASKPSAVTQPENQIGLSFHVGQWVKEKAKAEHSDPDLIVNQILDKEREKEKERCKPPFILENCRQVAVWDCYDGTWERLLYDNSTKTFYLVWSFADPADVTISEALHWYGQKRALDCDYGCLEWSGIEILITRAASELHEWEQIQKRGLAAVQENRREAYAEFKQLAEAGGAK